MEYILYISRFLYRIRWWIILGTLLITATAYYLTRNLGRTYNVEATVYTGVASGYSLEQTDTRVDWATTQNAIDNLINIMRSESTLQRVSIRLYARNLINGNPKEDNEYIKASNYNWMYNHVKNSPNGAKILSLIDKSSEDKTVANLTNYLRPTKDNYVYGLFRYNHPHYSFNALKRIRVSRKDASDLLTVSYSTDDPGITYNTIKILMDEFVNEYRVIRYGETDKVIEYFKSELVRIGNELRLQEDSLTQYNVDKRIINYYDETKEIAAINKEFEIREQDILFQYNSSKAMIQELERQMDINAKQILNNLQFINKLREASTLTGKISEMETIPTDNNGESLENYKKRLADARKALSKISDNYVSSQHTKEGVAKTSIIEQWLDQTLQFEKAKSNLQIIQQSRRDLDDKYRFFAPVGSTIKQKERSISFIEQSYLTTLKSYNDALMRRKNLEMTSATIKVLNPPAYPIISEPTARKKIVMAAFLASFLFILGFFLLQELLDRTLRDSIRTRRLTNLNILGAFPKRSSIKHRKYENEYHDIAVRQLSSSVLRFFTVRKKGLPYIVNFLSTESGEGKTYLSEYLLDYWRSIGLKVHKLTWGVDFDPTSRKYLLAESITDLYAPQDEDIVIVEYPNLKQCNIPENLLQNTNLNLLIARADRGWKATDKIELNKLKELVGSTPIHIFLNNASRNVVEDYTGMLPPYTFTRKQIYRLSQLALTEKVSYKVRKKPIEEEDDDDE